MLAQRGRVLRFLRATALEAGRSDLRAGWDDGTLTEPYQVLQRLASLTWNHCPTDRMIYLHRGASNRASVVGGFGLGEPDLDPARLAPNALAGLAAEGRCDPLFVDATLHGHLLALTQEGRAVGWWCVAWAEGEPAPDVDTLVELARWVSERLDLPLDRFEVARVRNQRLDAELESLEASLRASHTDRARQTRTFEAIDLPLLAADRSGQVVFGNDAMRDLLASAGIPPVRSIRELAFRLEGEAFVAERMRDLFAGREPLEFPWEGPGGTYTIHMAPITRGGGELLGFAAWCADRAEVRRLEDLLWNTVYIGDVRIREGLMGVLGGARLLRRFDGGPEIASLADVIETSADDVLAFVDQLRQSLEGPAVAPIDPAEVTERAVAAAVAGTGGRGEVDLDLPEVAFHAWAVPGQAERALRDLVALGLSQARAGSAVRVALEQDPDSTRLVIAWEGPGLDPTVVEAFEGAGEEGVELPAVQPLLRARRAFEAVTVDSRPGDGVRVQVQLAHEGASA